jgi:hypothetical protein
MGDYPRAELKNRYRLHILRTFAFWKDIHKLYNYLLGYETVLDNLKKRQNMSTEQNRTEQNRTEL